jgi:hypothetical protein
MPLCFAFLPMSRNTSQKDIDTNGVMMAKEP